MARSVRWQSSKNKKKTYIMKNGFTLIEILLVVAIIIALTGVAIPNLLQIRLISNEQNAISNIQAISVASKTFSSIEGDGSSFPSKLVDLRTGKYLTDDTLACDSQPCIKGGYKYKVGGNGEELYFYVYALPKTPNVTGKRSFCSCSDGVVRYNTLGAEPDSQADCFGWSPVEI
jgi:prepilin-type N-terminal cleavage/methylation domain-containing protein